MAPDLATRIRDKLSRRRHSFTSTFSFSSKRSTSSSLKDISTHPEKGSSNSSLQVSPTTQATSHQDSRSHHKSCGSQNTATTKSSQGVPQDEAAVLMVSVTYGEEADGRESRADARERSPSPTDATDLPRGTIVESPTMVDAPGFLGAGGEQVQGIASTTSTTANSLSDTHFPPPAAEEELQGSTAEDSSPTQQLQSSPPSSPGPQSPPQLLHVPTQLHSIKEASSFISSTYTPQDGGASSRPRTREAVDPHEAGDAKTTTNLDDPSSPSNEKGNALRRDTYPDTLSLNLADKFHPPADSSIPTTPVSFSARTHVPKRRQSLLSYHQSTLIKSLLQGSTAYDSEDNGSGLAPIEIDAKMVLRKIWVKRANASPTLVSINEEDLVDDVRDAIIRKYTNSIGRTFDAPDLTIRICPREQQHRERLLGPEEPICRTLDAYYPGGQTVEEALIIDLPARRTPKPSPRLPGGYYVADDVRPSEAAEGYFPPVGGVPPSPHHPVAVQAPTNGTVPHSISVLGTGHIPPIPSPGATRPRGHRERTNRPRVGRTHTSSPQYVATGTTGDAHAMQHYNSRPSHSRAHSNSSEYQKGLSSTAAPLTSSPVPVTSHPHPRSSTPPPRVSSPRPSANRKKSRRTADYPSLPTGTLSGGVPPINVLIVEDNPINMKLLEAFVKRLKVRWDTAVNGREAVDKWMGGGFHLVLMDIQLPVLDGLDATREIRRLERVNSIGVFSSSPGSFPENTDVEELKEQDRLENRSLFKSPVIIVALTASSLQSDRHQALAAGCNDFLTKPVNFVWLERKVMEWGCMQALIDFDGWRQWKDFSQTNEENDASKTSAAAKAKVKKKNRSSLSTYT